MLDTKPASMIASELAFAKAALQAAQRLGDGANSLRVAASIEVLIGRFGPSEQLIAQVAKHAEANERS